MTTNDEPNNPHDTLAEIFGEPIHTYSRAEAIEDGELIEASPRALAAARMVLPTVYTCALYHAHIEASDAVREHWARLDPKLAKATTIVHEVALLIALREAIKKSGGTDDRLDFVFPSFSRETGEHVQVEAWALVGPGDTDAPVLTIMLRGED